MSSGSAPQGSPERTRRSDAAQRDRERYGTPARRPTSRYREPEPEPRFDDEDEAGRNGYDIRDGYELRDGRAQLARDDPERDPDPDPRRRAMARRQQAADRARRSGRNRAARPTASDAARRGSDLPARILVAVPLAIIAIGFVHVGGLAFAVLMALVSVLCLHELYRMLARWRPVGIVGYAAAAAMVVAAYYGTDRTVLEVGMIALPVTFLAVLVAAPDGMASVSVAGTVLGIYWVGFAFAHAVLLRQLPHGSAIVLDVMLGTFLGDTGAYFGGRTFGRRPLAPEISPNKTVEGLVIGMLVAVLAVFIAGLYEQPYVTSSDALALGVAVAILGPLGDLFESMIKRDAGTKDAGTLFGAHGGALDRLDALMFTLIAGYYVWTAVLH